MNTAFFHSSFFPLPLTIYHHEITYNPHGRVTLPVSVKPFLTIRIQAASKGQRGKPKEGDESIFTYSHTMKKWADAASVEPYEDLKIFLGNLAPSVRTDVLINLFKEAGSVESARFVCSSPNLRGWIMLLWFLRAFLLFYSPLFSFLAITYQKIVHASLDFIVEVLPLIQ